MADTKIQYKYKINEFFKNERFKIVTVNRRKICYSVNPLIFDYSKKEEGEKKHKANKQEETL